MPLAVSHLVKAAPAFAQDSLGYMYDKGQGVQQNYAEAIKWYRKATTSQNWIKVYTYICVAAAMNNQTAREKLSSIQERMTPKQVAEGQKQAEILWNKLQASGKLPSP